MSNLIKLKQINILNYIKMELSDYDILGVTDKASFRLVKNAYHELSEFITWSSQTIIGMIKDDKKLHFENTNSLR